MTSIPAKIRLTHVQDPNGDPMRQAAEAIAQIYPRLRIALCNLSGLPVETVRLFMDDVDVLHAIAMHDKTPDGDLIDAIDHLLGYIYSDDLEGDERDARAIIAEELSAVRATWQNVMDRIHAEVTVRARLGQQS
ncbi:hypothetical protein ACN2XU_22810 [Primorskyibacter sp. 2E107]|uniref:hypothetical protein n=1 Tax=Primorskyibacter sp. 2E107 TaxID=3403458 RepID=UPI003AF90048